METKINGLSVENKYEKLLHHTKSISNILKTQNGKCDVNHSSPENSPTHSSSLESSIYSDSNEEKRIHRVVFTGGPCAGKTTSINRIRNFFENIGWKVLCVPETATTLLSSGIFFTDLDEEGKIKFQENLLKTLLQIEDTINETARCYANEKNVMVIYDRGAMDPVSYVASHEWEILKMRNPNWNEVDLRDNRYDQIIHLVTAANGAEQYYTLENNIARTESIELARELDERCAKAWVGHPCMDVIGNSTVFDTKVTKALQSVCERVGLNLKGFEFGNKKKKYLVKVLPDDSVFTNYQELTVVHNYLVSSSDSVQVRIRKSGQGGNWSYSYAIRTYEDGQPNETRTQIDRREYAILSKTIDPNHYTIYQRRRCFIWQHRYYRLDIYEEPCNPSCRGLVILSARTNEDDLLLPNFIQVEQEITDDSLYSMFNLSAK
ncbi:unnamed protein product [Brachionus calyciflorus]|uniref:NadR/Ttd14 AAA domain-containing protein n=1 Tax=Brachionus calyciflorus TaxID=104777 RepID=A0A813MAP3_9BILA|nr:unnamed protein product [Brachionus calyciflorus]